MKIVLASKINLKRIIYSLTSAKSGDPWTPMALAYLGPLVFHSIFSSLLCTGLVILLSTILLRQFTLSNAVGRETISSHSLSWFPYTAPGLCSFHSSFISSRTEGRESLTSLYKPVISTNGGSFCSFGIWILFTSLSYLIVLTTLTENVFPPMESWAIEQRPGHTYLIGVVTKQDRSTGNV